MRATPKTRTQKLLRTIVGIRADDYDFEAPRWRMFNAGWAYYEADEDQRAAWDKTLSTFGLAAPLREALVEGADLADVAAGRFKNRTQATPFATGLLYAALQVLAWTIYDRPKIVHEQKRRAETARVAAAQNKAKVLFPANDAPSLLSLRKSRRY